jgi:hypothetical protein
MNCPNLSCDVPNMRDDGEGTIELYTSEEVCAFGRTEFAVAGHPLLVNMHPFMKCGCVLKIGSTLLLVLWLGSFACCCAGRGSWQERCLEAAAAAV